MIKLDHLFIIYNLFLPGLVPVLMVNYYCKNLWNIEFLSMSSDSFTNSAWTVLLSILFGFFLRSLAQLDTWFFSKSRLHRYMYDIFLGDHRSKHKKELASLFSRTYQEEFGTSFLHSSAYSSKDGSGFKRFKKVIEKNINHVYNQIERSQFSLPNKDVKHSIQFLESLIVGLTYCGMLYGITAVSYAILYCPETHGCLWSIDHWSTRFVLISCACILLSLPLHHHLRHLDKSLLLSIIISFNQFFHHENRTP